jgi:hypothetical protein
MLSFKESQGDTFGISKQYIARLKFDSELKPFFILCALQKGCHKTYWAKGFSSIFLEVSPKCLNNAR